MNTDTQEPWEWNYDGDGNLPTRTVDTGNDGTID